MTVRVSGRSLVFDRAGSYHLLLAGGAVVSLAAALMLSGLKPYPAWRPPAKSEGGRPPGGALLAPRPLAGYPRRIGDGRRTGILDSSRTGLRSMQRSWAP